MYFKNSVVKRNVSVFVSFLSGVFLPLFCFSGCPHFCSIRMGSDGDHEEDAEDKEDKETMCIKNTCAHTTTRLKQSEFNRCCFFGRQKRARTFI